MPGKSPITRDYITVWVPSDFEEDPERRRQHAIYQAREEMTTFVLPCNWRVVWDNGEYVRVCRESRRVRKARKGKAS